MCVEHLALYPPYCNKLLSSSINYLGKLSIISDNQFGFRSKHCTIHALLLLTDKIQKAIDKGTYSCDIFLDLCKAFDTVNHNILLTKLEYYGIRGVAHAWFTSYLSDRKQFVPLHGTNSEYQTLTCGVPQGSVLGLLLFLLYVNEICNCSSILEFHLFADETNVFLSDTNIQKLELNLNIELGKVSHWLNANKLSLNIEKTSFVIFHPPQRKITYQMNLRISNNLIKQDSKVKYLGLIIDSNLNWKSHLHELPYILVYKSNACISRTLFLKPEERFWLQRNRQSWMLACRTTLASRPYFRC